MIMDFEFIAFLKREQGLVEVRQAKFIAGEQPPKRVKTQVNERTMEEFIASYFYRPRMEFLREVAHHFGMDNNEMVFVSEAFAIVSLSAVVVA